MVSFAGDHEHSNRQHDWSKGAQKGGEKGKRTGGQKGNHKGSHKSSHKGGQQGGHKGGQKGGQIGGYPNQTDSSSLMSCTCIFLESNKYFLEDVFEATDPLTQLRYLFGLARVAADLLPSDEAEVLDVNRGLRGMAREAAQQWSREDLRRSLIQTPKTRQNQFKLKAFLLAENSDNEVPGGLDVLQNLARLRFIQGPISIFKVNLPRAVADHGLTAECHAAVLAAYATSVRGEQARRRQEEDLWEVNLPEGILFVRCAVTCAVHFSNEDLYVLMVWESKRNEIKFPGGDVIHQTDQDLPAAARREFLEELEES